MLYNLPIERLPMRYSDDWHTWFEGRGFESFNIDFTTIRPESSGHIHDGEFLDIVETHVYKTKQLEHILNFFQEKTVKDNDVFFFHDLWHPAVTTLSYLRNATGIDFKICGCLHAGAYDEHDYLFQKGMNRWAEALENSWFKAVDGIFVATNYHKNLLMQKRDVCPDRVFVTGFPIYIHCSNADNYDILRNKENIVVFPHRLAPEKQPDAFRELAKGWPEKRPDAFRELAKEQKSFKFIETQTAAENKDDYYALLKKAKVVISFSRQETWGIAMQEAVMSWCIPLVPNRLSYPEMYAPEFIYDHADSLQSKLRYIIENVNSTTHPLYQLLSTQRNYFINSGKHAINNIMSCIIRMSSKDILRWSNLT